VPHGSSRGYSARWPGFRAVLLGFFGVIVLPGPARVTRGVPVCVCSGDVLRGRLGAVVVPRLGIRRTVVTGAAVLGGGGSQPAAGGHIFARGPK